MTLGLGKMIRAPGSVDHPAGVGQVFGQQIANRQLTEVFDIGRQVQREGITVLDHLAGHGKELELAQLVRCTFQLAPFNQRLQVLVQAGPD